MTAATSVRRPVRGCSARRSPARWRCSRLLGDDSDEPRRAPARGSGSASAARQAVPPGARRRRADPAGQRARGRRAPRPWPTSRARTRSACSTSRSPASRRPVQAVFAGWELDDATSRRPTRTSCARRSERRRHRPRRARGAALHRGRHATPCRGLDVRQHVQAVPEPPFPKKFEHGDKADGLPGLPRRPSRRPDRGQLPAHPGVRPDHLDRRAQSQGGSRSQAEEGRPGPQGQRRRQQG